MYTSILVPTDGSDVSIRAAEEAFELAEKFDATVHIIYSVATIETGTIENASAETAHLYEIGENSLEKAETLANEYDAEVNTAVEVGSPHAAILDYADEHDIELIVMGTHGRTGAERVLLGSTTERVMRHTSRPVLTVH